VLRYSSEPRPMRRFGQRICRTNDAKAAHAKNPARSRNSFRYPTLVWHKTFSLFPVFLDKAPLTMY